MKENFRSNALEDLRRQDRMPRLAKFRNLRIKLKVTGRMTQLKGTDRGGSCGGGRWWKFPSEFFSCPQK